MLIIATWSHAATIRVPGDAATILDAVAMAASGDTILLVSDVALMWSTELDWNQTVTVRVENIDLTITSDEGCEILFPLSEANPDSPFLEIENAKLHLKNVKIITPPRQWGVWGTIARSIHSVSGYLAIENCDLTCPMEVMSNLLIRSSILRGNSFVNNTVGGYNNQSSTTPTLQLGPADGITIEIAYSSIRSDGPESYICVVATDLTNSTIRIHDGWLVGGYFRHGTSPRSAPYTPQPGSHALALHKCDISMEFGRIVAMFGGMGFNAVHFASYNSFREGGSGGSGIFLEDSIVRLQCEEGVFRGGDGGRSWLSRTVIADPFNFKFVRGGAGGHGIHLVCSHMQYQFGEVHAMGGVGAAGAYSFADNQELPGAPNGLPVFMDEFSTFEPLTAIEAWEGMG